MSNLMSKIKVENTTYELKDEKARNDISNINSKISSLASGSPLVATSIEEMTDTTKTYVNTTDGNWYYYNGTTWVSGGTYQSEGIANNSIDNKKLIDNSINTRTTEFLNVVSDNLFNGNLYPGFINASGVYTESEIYKHTDYIPIEYGKYINFLISSTPPTDGVLMELCSLNQNFRFVTWYDKEFNPIVGNGFSNEGMTTKKSVQAIDPNVAYAVITISINALTDEIVNDRLMIITSDSELATDTLIPYTRYKEKLNKSVFNNETCNNTIKIINEYSYDNIIKKPSSNLLNPLANTYGAMQRNGIQQGDYYYTPKIKINKGQFLTLRKGNVDDNYTSIDKIRLVAFYDFTDRLVQYYDNSNRINEAVECTSPDVAYCIATIFPESNNNGYMLTVTDIDTTNDQVEFISFDGKVLLPSNDLIDLSNKKLVNFGDSIAAGDNGTSYGEQVSVNNGMVYRNYAKGGATLSNGTNSIYTQVQTFISDYDGVEVDSILLNGGTNDISSNSTFGSITEFYVEDDTNTWDISTSAGALEKLLYLLKSNHPESKIIYVIPHKMNTRNYQKQIEIFNIVKEICSKWSVPVVSVFDDGNLNTFVEDMRIYSDHGTHPTTEGYTKFYVPLVDHKIKEII